MLELLVGALVTWRITSLLVNEDGPADMFARLRDHLGVRFDEISHCAADSPYVQTLCCVWCTSIWVGWVVALFTAGHDVFWLGLAYSAAAIIIDRWVKR